MVRSIGAFAYTALGLVVVAGGGASAAMTEQDMFELRFQGLHLGMTRGELDRLIASRVDISEPRPQLGPLDCSFLAPVEEAPAKRQDGPMVVSAVNFGDAGGRSYQVRFSINPDEDLASQIDYSEIRGGASWAAVSDELTGRFGRPDLTGEGRDGVRSALWCSDAADCSLASAGSSAQLRVTFRPDHGIPATGAGRLDFSLDEGRRRYQAWRKALRQLRTGDPAEANRRYWQCRNPAGKFSSRDEATLHYLSLWRIWPDEGRILQRPEAVPATVLAAAGLERGRDYGPNVCFNSSDAGMTSTPECKTYTSVALRWARQNGDVWLLAFVRGGFGVRWDYTAVRKDGQGLYRKVWWGADTAAFGTWLASGGVPLGQIAD